MPPSKDTVVHVEPYSVLAAGYDVVMEHVEYDTWAAYVHQLIEKFHPDAEHVLELGCGTGSLALHLQPKGLYHYTATDRSETMIRVARRKAREAGIAVRFGVADFTNFKVSEPVDVVLLLYDGLNYALDKEKLHRLFQQVVDAIHEDGLFIVDQSTPANSLNNEAYFDDEGTIGGFRYVRRSSYDPDTRRHTTCFDLTVEGKTYREEHVQRAYSLEEMRLVVDASSFSVAACYDGFTFENATTDTERIHWVLRKHGTF